MFIKVEVKLNWNKIHAPKDLPIPKFAVIPAFHHLIYNKVKNLGKDENTILVKYEDSKLYTLPNVKIHIFEDTTEKFETTRFFLTLVFEIEHQIRLLIRYPEDISDETWLRALKEIGILIPKGRKCIYCGRLCLKIGEINRFNVKKEYCCRCYMQTSHKALHNPEFSYKNYCELCKGDKNDQ